MNTYNFEKQLRMVWPVQSLAAPPEVRLPRGFTLRTYRPGDEDAFYAVMALAGWEGWNESVLQPWKAKIIPASWFMVIHKESERLAATAMGLHNYKGSYPFWSELGWLAADPDFSGNALGMGASAAVTSRLISAGYRKIQLFTEDYRLPALKTYLRLGYVPSLYTGDMLDRWNGICDVLEWPFTPEEWRSMEPSL
jgi:mycothiol synthase